MKTSDGRIELPDYLERLGVFPSVRLHLKYLNV